MKKKHLKHKGIALISVLQCHFKGNLNLVRVKFICLFITALCKIKTINYDTLTSRFDTKADNNGSYRKIQRFIKEYDFPMKIISSLIFNTLPFKDDLDLVLDRTNWKFGSKNINILMLGIRYKNVAFPLLITMLDKKGNSDTNNRIDLVNKYIVFVWCYKFGDYLDINIRKFKNME